MIAALTELAAASAPTTTPAPLTLDDQIRNAASLVSIALALLTLFTNRRLAKLDEDRKNDKLRAWDREVAGHVALDAALLALSVLVMIAIAPLVVSSWPLDLGRQDAVMRSLMTILAAGLLGVAAVQTWLLGTRVIKANGNSKMKRRNLKERKLRSDSPHPSVVEPVATGAQPSDGTG